MDKTIGQVYKAHSDTYTVKCDDKFYNCHARGVLKIKSDGISVGDYVFFDKKTITEVLPRKNKFIRPNVANVDTIVVVVSPEPKPDFYLIDKLILNAVKENAEIILVINKTDVECNLYEDIRNEYKNLDIKLVKISAHERIGIEELKSNLINKLSVLAGQSAVGKTSIVNAMFNLSLKTGELSEKILRGRHTTTRSEIFEMENIKLVDSPGFAVIDAQVDIEELPDCYPEYLKVSNECKYRGCSHVSEPECAVKTRVENGIYSKNRYNRYVEIYSELSKRRKNYEKN